MIESKVEAIAEAAKILAARGAEPQKAFKEACDLVEWCYEGIERGYLEEVIFDLDALHVVLVPFMPDKTPQK